MTDDPVPPRFDPALDGTPDDPWVATVHIVAALDALGRQTCTRCGQTIVDDRSALIDRRRGRVRTAPDGTIVPCGLPAGLVTTLRPPRRAQWPDVTVPGALTGATPCHAPPTRLQLLR